MGDARRSHRALIENMAKEAFADHVVKRVGPGHWFCGKPGTGIYHFRVLVAPQYVILVGDLGDLVLFCSPADSLNWIRTSPSIDYILGKCSKPQREFLADEAETYLEELAAEDPAKADKIRGLWSPEHGDDGTAWRRAYYEGTGDYEVPGCDDWSSQMLWQAHALLWFSNHVDQTGEPVSVQSA